MKRRLIIKEARSTLMWPKICFACEKFMNQISGIIYVEKFLLKTIVVHKIKKKPMHFFLITEDVMNFWVFRHFHQIPREVIMGSER